MDADWNEIQEFLIGEIGKSEKDCYQVTFVEYRAYVKAKKNRIIQGWEYVRFLAWRHELLSNIKPAYKHSTPEAFMPLPCDNLKKKKLIAPINQRLSSELEEELYRVIGFIKKG